jgi:hypothetical protein
MALLPLQQWFCDRCGDVIEKPEDGWVHWSEDKKGVHTIEILHHLTASPRGGGKSTQGCYPSPMDCDMHLQVMLGPGGLAHLLSMVDVGAYHDEDGTSVGKVDLRNWTEVVRRLHIPFYEEGRRHFREARSNGDLEGINEIALYREDVLQRLVEQYAE